MDRNRRAIHFQAAAGFTLVELSITTTIIIVIALLSIVALNTSSSSAALATARSQVTAEARDVLSIMTAELQQARKNDPFSSVPFIEVVENPVEGSPIEIVFTVPTDGTGENFSGPIRYRWVNEDTSEANGLLDANEDDLDGDGVLTRRLLRIEELIPATEDDEAVLATRIIGAANNLADVRFNLRENAVDISVTATRPISGRIHRDAISDDLVVDLAAVTINTTVFMLN